MSEQDKRRGPQGVQGVQGVEGIEGQGTQGIQGKTGERGIPGARGRGVLPPGILLAFGIVVLIAFIILGVFGLQVRQTRETSQENRALIEQNSSLIEQLGRTCRDGEVLKVEARRQAILEKMPEKLAMFKSRSC